MPGGTALGLAAGWLGSYWPSGVTRVTQELVEGWMPLGVRCEGQRSVNRGATCSCEFQ